MDSTATMPSPIATCAVGDSFSTSSPSPSHLLPALTAEWCTKGFKGTCISSTVLGKHCFFLDVVVEEIKADDECMAMAMRNMNAEEGGDADADAPPSLCGGESLTAPPALHLVGDHVIQTAPRTLKGFMMEQFGTCATLGGGGVGEDRGDKGEAGETITAATTTTAMVVESPSTAATKPLFIVSVYCGRNEHSLSPDGFVALSASLRANPNVPNTPPCPRVGDVLHFPPNNCFSRPTATSAPFPTRSVLGAMIPVLNARDGAVLVKRGIPHKPADFADRWQMEKKIKIDGANNAAAAANAVNKSTANSNGEEATIVNKAGEGKQQKKQQQHKKRGAGGDGKQCCDHDDNEANGGDNAHHLSSSASAAGLPFEKRQQKDGRAGHAARFNIVANWLTETFQLKGNTNNSSASNNNTENSSAGSRVVRLIDVAGGSGKLGCELALMGYHCTVVDPRIVDSAKLAVTMDSAMRQEKHREVTRRFFLEQRGGDEGVVGPEGEKEKGTLAVGGIVAVGEKRPRCAEEEDDGQQQQQQPNDQPNKQQKTRRAALTAEEIAETERQKQAALGRLSLCHSLFDEADVNKFFSSNGSTGGGNGMSAAVDNGGDNATTNAASSSFSSFDELVSSCDVIVGLHCDGAVNAIIEAACRYKKHFAIIPCCVFPTIFERWLEVEDNGEGSEGGKADAAAAQHEKSDVAGDSTIGSSNTANVDIVNNGSKDVESSSSSSSSHPHPHPHRQQQQCRRRLVPVIDREELVTWIPQQARRLGFDGQLLTCVPDKLVGANACVYGIAN